MKVEKKNVALPNGETLTYRERKGGERNLLLIHGNMASSIHWDVFLEEMDETYTIYAVDLRGYGDSTYREPIRSIKDFTTDLKHFVDQIGLEAFSIIGWSNGGGVAMQYAANYPQHVEKIILLASLSTRGYPIYQSEESENGSTTNRLTSKEEILDDPRLAVTLQAISSKDKQYMKKAWDYLVFDKVQPSEERYDRYIEAALQQRNTIDVMHAANYFNISSKWNGLVDGTGEIRLIEAPVLVLWGKEDRLTSESMIVEIVEDLESHGKEAKLVYLDAGHFPFIDDLDHVMKEIHDFL
ncbi:alpha/beta fold hydrolase [Bacillus horti]|uniref:Pimeloyl-ACP methyl ester carboxylesterase n=1 Tax=Caldalkalibacillus horti TaxID=77523 RepID=A0ABT9W0Z2_9BACI|nr:alpha/beta hydrolase [Bacillus horti]MDQ0166904.1 pimeloyl-ACP methyl ester carboxylesterase [Bacillus horti]